MTIQYDPQKVTDWLTPLEKVYARQSQQLDTYHSQLRQRDQQEEAAVVNVPEMFSKLASFSKTIGSVVEARKKEQKSKEWENVNKVLNTAEASEEARNILEPYKLNKKGLVDEWKTFEEKVKKSTVLLPEQKDYLLEQSARRQLRVKEVLGQRKASELPNLWTDAINNKTEWQDKYRKYEIAGDTNGIAALRQEFVNKTIGDYKYSDGFLFENVKKESDRFLSTKNTTDKIKAKNIKLTNKEATFEESNNQLLLTGTPEQLGDLNYDYVTDKAVLASDPAAYETAIQQGTDKWVFTQEKFLLTTKDSHGDLEKLLNSKVEHGAFVDKKNNPKGITTFRKAFLSDEQVQRLTKAANEGVKVKWETNKAGKELEQMTFLQKVQSGQSNKKEWLAEIEVLERSPHANKELIKELKELDPDAQNAAVEADLIQEWDVHIENGFYGKTEEDIEAIPNYNVKKKAREKWAQLKKADVKHGTSKGDMDQTVHRSRTAIPWANKESMDPTGKLIARELDIAGEQYRAGLVYDQYKTGTYIPDPEIATKTNLFKKALWESRGGGKEGGDGRYSVDVMEGSFKNFQTASRMRIRANDSHNLKYTVENGDAWAKGIQTKMSAFKTPEGDFDYQGFIESGQAYSKQDLIGTITNGSYSEKMQYIADYLNTDVETLFESSLKEANKDKEFARRWSFEQLKDPIDTQIRKDLERAFQKYEGDSKTIESYQLKDLKYLMKKGWKNLSNNQKSRVYATLVANSTLSEEAGADADEARQEKDKAVADALSLERLQVEQKRRKEKEDKEKQRNEQAEQLQEQIEGLWTP